MGSINTKDFQEMIEDEMPPPTPQKVKYIDEEEFDPRSPTLGITRTPIQILKVPGNDLLDDPRSPTVGIDRTPICPSPVRSKVHPIDFSASPASVVNDPRSPTQGIDRTPIVTGKHDKLPCNNQQNASLMPVAIVDPRSPTQGIDRTPICHLEDKEFDEKCSSTVSTDIVDDDILSEAIRMSSLEDEMSVIPQQLYDDLVLNFPNLDDEMKKETTLKEKVPLTKKTTSKKAKNIILSHTNVKTVDIAEDPVDGKYKDKSTRSPLKVLGDSCRSPLSSRNSVDYNSPRAIVQRKQSGKVPIRKSSMQMKPLTMKNSPKYKTMDEEKENL